MSKESLRAVALRELEGVGSESDGQWEESGKVAIHIRRRLSESERKRMGDLEAIDIRNTPEYAVRRVSMQRYLPPHLSDWNE